MKEDDSSILVVHPTSRIRAKRTSNKWIELIFIMQKVDPKYKKLPTIF